MELKPDFGNDEYETPSYVLDMILDELDSTKFIIWEPFRGSGWSTDYMQKQGFEVTNGEHADFFQHTTIPQFSSRTKELIVISNPPYSKKKEILQKLRQLNIKKLALFIPMGTMTCRYFKELFPQDQTQVIIHTKSCMFLHPRTHKFWPLPAPFDTIWVTNGLSLKYDVQYKNKPPTKHAAI